MGKCVSKQSENKKDPKVTSSESKKNNMDVQKPRRATWSLSKCFQVIPDDEEPTGISNSGRNSKSENKMDIQPTTVARIHKCPARRDDIPPSVQNEGKQRLKSATENAVKFQKVNYTSEIQSDGGQGDGNRRINNEQTKEKDGVKEFKRKQNIEKTEKGKVSGQEIAEEPEIIITVLVHEIDEATRNSNQDQDKNPALVHNPTESQPEKQEEYGTKKGSGVKELESSMKLKHVVETEIKGEEGINKKIQDMSEPNRTCLEKNENVLKKKDLDEYSKNDENNKNDKKVNKRREWFLEQNKAPETRTNYKMPGLRNNDSSKDSKGINENMLESSSVRNPVSSMLNKDVAGTMNFDKKENADEGNEKDVFSKPENFKVLDTTGENFTGSSGEGFCEESMEVDDQKEPVCDQVIEDDVFHDCLEGVAEKTSCDEILDEINVLKTQSMTQSNDVIESNLKEELKETPIEHSSEGHSNMQSDEINVSTTQQSMTQQNNVIESNLKEELKETPIEHSSEGHSNMHSNKHFKRNPKRTSEKEKVYERIDEQKRRKLEDQLENVDKRCPKGLQNLGNTCFFNSVMQNLYQTRALEAALNEPGSESNKKKKYEPLTASLIEFYKQTSPKSVFNQICIKSSRFKGGHQQDSHELLRHLMDGLRNEEKEMSSNPQKMLTLVDKVFGGHYMTVYTCHVCTLPYHLCEPMLDISLPVTFSNNECEQSLESDVDQALRELGKEDYKEAIKTMMTRYGLLDPHLDPNKTKKYRSVEDCLRFFTREEFLDEYLCMACYNKRQERGETELVMTAATKQTLVYNPPAILTLHLKRFEQTAYGFEKANNAISFEEILDLGPFCSLWSKRVQPDEKNIWYSLYGIVVHGGSLSGGHYVAYVKAKSCDIASLKGFQQKKFLDRDGITEEALVEEMRKWSESQNRSEYKPSAIEGDWYYVSDSDVRKSSWEEVRKKQAYLLFYDRLKNTKETKRRNIREEGTAV